MNKLRKSKKGFTLIELIVVIVIIAILVAALTPAILGVIDRANKSADEADARSILMASSVVAISQTNTNAIPPNGTGVGQFSTLLTAELLGGNFRPGMAFTITFQGSMAVTCEVTGGSRSNKTPRAIVGSNPAPTGADIQTRNYTVPTT